MLASQSRITRSLAAMIPRPSGAQASPFTAVIGEHQAAAVVAEHSHLSRPRIHRRLGHGRGDRLAAPGDLTRAEIDVVPAHLAVCQRSQQGHKPAY